MRSLFASVLTCVVVATLTACAGPQTMMVAPKLTLPNAATQTMPTQSAWWREAPDSVKEGVYVSSSTASQTSAIYGFRFRNKKNAPPKCTISGEMDVFDIASDAAANLYVPTFAAGTNIINVYAPGCGKLIARVTDPFGNPSGAAAHGNTFYIQDLDGSIPVCTLSGCASVLTDPSIQSGSGGSVAVDSVGNVWAAVYDHSFAIELVVWPHAKMPGHIVTGYVNATTPGGIEFDNFDRLVAIDSTVVRIYSCRAGNATCSTTRAFPLQGKSVFGALNRRNTNLQVTDREHGSVDVYVYPSFRYLYSYGRGPNGPLNPIGIAQTR